ncbi:MAG: hypothetical protein K5647_01185 [Clostridiales bacterium]|nr:hypothetical protein [Clostridiales bacterium]
MRKHGRLTVAVSMLILFAIALSVSASAAVKPTDYSAFGQVHLTGYTGGTVPTVDGVIGDGEYQNVYEQKDGTAGFSYDADASKAIITNIKFGITVTDDAIYLGITVTEPNYKPRVGSTAGSYMAFSLGFNMGDKFYQSMDRQTITLSITDQNALFKANTVLTYAENGKFNGTDTPKYAGNVIAAAEGKRDDSKGVTVYEVKLLKDKMIEAQKGYDADGNLIADYKPFTEIGNEFYVHYEAIGYNAAGTKGTARFRDILSEDAKSQIRTQDGWVASFAPHIITFTDKPAETEPETTQAQQTEAVTTQAQTTGGSGSTSPSTGDSTVWIAFGVVAMLAAAAIVIAVRKVRD